MTGITTNGIEIDREIPASPRAVFDAWVQPTHFARWFGGKDVEVPFEHLDFVAEPDREWTAQMALPDGNTIEWAGTFLVVIPERRLEFTLSDRPAEPERATIVVELSPVPTGTFVHFEQDTPGFSESQQEAVLAGWQSFIDEIQAIATE